MIFRDGDLDSIRRQIKKKKKDEINSVKYLETLDYITAYQAYSKSLEKCLTCFLIFKVASHPSKILKDFAMSLNEIKIYRDSIQAEMKKQFNSKGNCVH